MALTSCPACSGRVSDQAATCPHCGHPLRNPAAQPSEDWQKRFRQIHRERGLVRAVQYLRDTGIRPSEIRTFLEQEKAAGRIPKLQEASD
jgi:predicted amidophosphoribosyltransferase